MVSVSSELRLISPLTGTVVRLEDVPDPVFSGRMMGDGLAIDPQSGTLVAPCDGVVSHLHRARHALTLTADNGAEILMHIGIDTVRLNGEGFTARVKPGTRVRAGDEMIRFDVDRVAREVPSLHTIVAVTNGDGYGIAWRTAAHVEAGVSPLMTLRARDKRPAAPRPGGPESSATAVIGHSGGLHARPAAVVQAAVRRFNAEVTIELADRQARASSVVSLMGLGTNLGDRVTVRAWGPAAQAALAAVVAALETPIASAHDPASEPGAAQAAAEPRDAQCLVGVCASPGLAVGRIVRLDAAEVEPPAHTGNIDTEYDRLATSLARVRDDIAAAIRDADARHAAHERDIFMAHQALLDDPEIVGSAERAVGDGDSAGAAVRRAMRAQCEVFAGLPNPLIVGRMADLRELERRVLLAMTERAEPEPELFDQSILVADDLALSVLTRLPRARIAGLCTARGGATSHVAILARAFGVPALVAMGAPVFLVPHGTEVVLDARAGYLDPAPDAMRLAQARSAIAEHAARAARALVDAAAPAVTRDGRVLEVGANVATDADTADAVRRGADGVGLVRTEVLFIDRHDAPDEAEQRVAYQRVVDALGGRPAIIRTLDVGGDKPLPFLPLPEAANPALGLRGIRAGFARPDVLDVQLRALLAVRPPSACKIMLPMISDVAELVEIRRRLAALAAEMKIAQLPQLGVMIEVPSAAVLADQLAVHADFLSIGTNDLTQYTLAMDRCHPRLAAKLDGLHPAVLRLIAQTVAGAAKHHKWVGVCGELASDLEAVPVLVGLGITELSVTPSAVPEVKARVRRLSYDACRREAAAMLDFTSPAEVRARVRELWPDASA